MSLKRGDARERIILKARKSTLSLERRMMSAFASSKGGSASRAGDIGDLARESAYASARDMTVGYYRTRV